MFIAIKFPAAIGLIALFTLSIESPGSPDNFCTDIVRYDEANSRLFVVCAELPELSVEDLRNIVDEIFAGFDGPPDEYFISFFSSEDLAGYKTEECCVDALESGIWSKGYVGEYYTHSRILTLWPAMASKRRELQL